MRATLRGVRALLLSALATAAACYDPSFTRTKCSDQGECPPGLVCLSGIDVCMNLAEAGLAGLWLSAPADLSPPFEPAIATYTASVSFLVQRVSVVPTAVNPSDVILVNGEEVASGERAESTVLALGENELTIEVVSSASDNIAYTVTIDRGGAIVEHVYGKASNTDAGDRFGCAVALSEEILAVGAADEDSDADGVGGNQTDNEAVHAGAVYVFRRSGASWAQEAYLKASNSGAGDNFGASVTLWGDTLAVGAPGESSSATGIDGSEDNDGLPDSGAVYVFRRTGGVWTQEAYIKASNTGASDRFGTSVALWGDTLAVGAPSEASAATGVGGQQANNSAADAGAVYVFRRTGTAWAQDAYIKASNAEAGDRFGHSVALEEQRLAVGAWGEDSTSTGANGNQANNGAEDSGAAYVFRRAGDGWTQEAYFKASNTEAEDQFGASVSLSSDRLAVGASKEDGDGSSEGNDAIDAGAVYVFRRTDTMWAHEEYVKAEHADAGDEFGKAVAVVDGLLAVGAWGEDSRATGIDGAQTDNGASTAGAAYVFRRAGAAWTQEAYIKASNAEGGDTFGKTLALSGDTLAVGADAEDSVETGVNPAEQNNSAAESGAIYVFH